MSHKMRPTLTRGQMMLQMSLDNKHQFPRVVANNSRQQPSGHASNVIHPSSSQAPHNSERDNGQTPSTQTLFASMLSPRCNLITETSGIHTIHPDALSLMVTSDENTENLNNPESRSSVSDDEVVELRLVLSHPADVEEHAQYAAGASDTENLNKSTDELEADLDDSWVDKDYVPPVEPDESEEEDEYLSGDNGDSRESLADTRPVADLVAKDISGPTQRESRRKIRDIESWKKKFNSRKRNFGEEYLGHEGRGQVKRARQMKPGCGIGCRQKCHNKVSHEERERVLRQYWNIGDS